MPKHGGRWIALFFVALAALTIWAAWQATSPALGEGGATVSGRIVDTADTPVAGARVRVKLTTNLTLSDDEGRFALHALAAGVPITVTAWQEGYLVGWASSVIPPAGDVTIRLRRHYTTDNRDYAWYASHDQGDNLNCVHCMVAYPQWREDAHAQSALNPRFFSLYNGESLSGVPDSLGYKRDFPGTAGNCATCHAPAAADVGEQYFANADMNELEGVELEGIFCEFCHKVGDVYLDPMTGLPYDNAPGIVSMRLYRSDSGAGEMLFFGTLDDVTRRVSYLPLEKTSQFCAPCHQFSYWGTPIYESFSEWLDSSYAARGIECQACHMRATDLHYFVYPEKGGLTREYHRTANHLQPGASDETLLQNTVALTVTATISGGVVVVDTTLYNAFAGHHVPTDFPGRQMLLVLAATDDEGAPLPLLEGETLPAWAGSGDSPHDYAGQPGRGYAKLLRDVATGEMPTVAYWKQTLLVADTRLPAETADYLHHTFQAPAQGQVHLTARVVLRRLFLDTMRQKEWDKPDMEMARVALALSEGSVTGSHLPDRDKVFDAPDDVAEAPSVGAPPAASLPDLIADEKTPPTAPPQAASIPAHWKQSSTSIAITADGTTLLTANPDSHTLSIVSAATQKVLAELPVGWEPQTVAVDGRGKLAVVANRRSDDIAVVDLAACRVAMRVPVGREPVGVVVDRAGTRAYVALSGADAVVAVNLANGAIVGRVSVEPRPYGLALLPDERTLLVTHLLSGRTSVLRWESLHRLYLPLLLKSAISAGSSVATVMPATEALVVERVIASWPDANLSQRVIVSPDGSRAYLPQTRSNTANAALTFDTTVFPIVAVLDLTQGAMTPRENLAIDSIDEPVGIPTDAAFMPGGSYLWVVHSASNDVSVVDVRSRSAVRHLEVGDYPQGVVISPDGARAYVHNALSGDISVFDARTYQPLGKIIVTMSPLPPALWHGKQLFFSSDSREGERLAREQWISCNSCHFEGEHDGRTWQFAFAGPRNTTSLRGMIATYPLRWSAEWDESADAEFAIREEQFGMGLIAGEMYPPLGQFNQGRSYDLDCLALYLDYLAMRPSPHPFDEAAQRGEAIFHRPDTQCAVCHPAPLYTDLKTHDVGTTTPGERLGSAYDTPTLNGLWASAPYLHDGSAATLYDVLTTANPADRHGVTSHLNEAELADLIAFMLSLPRQQ